MIEILLNSGKLIRCTPGEASQLIEKGLGNYPGEEKAFQPAYENKMIEKPKRNKKAK
jgi:hypothetical protein